MSYLKENESSIHLQAKEKLFDLILSRRVKIYDQYGKEYKIFTGQFENEFLHIESFIMNYENKAIFSSNNPPCNIHLDKNNDKLCDQAGYYGAFKNLPCRSCIENNLPWAFEKPSEYASFRPDISFGYNGQHKIWLEVKYTSNSKINKIRFCHKNNIILLEIDAEHILNFNSYTGALIFNKLEYVNEEFDLTDIEDFVHKSLNENKYVYSQDVKSKIYNKGIIGIDYWECFTKILNKFNLTEIEHYSKPVQQYYGLNSSIKILVNNDDLTKFEMIEKEYYDKIYEEVYEITSKKAKELIEHIKKNTYMFTSEFKNKIIEVVPKGYRNKIDFKRLYEENDLEDIFYYDYVKRLNAIGITFKGNKEKRKLLLFKNTY